jgi:hypothetical protein
VQVLKHWLREHGKDEATAKVGAIGRMVADLIRIMVPQTISAPKA